MNGAFDLFNHDHDRLYDVLDLKMKYTNTLVGNI